MTLADALLEERLELEEAIEGHLAAEAACKTVDGRARIAKRIQALNATLREVNTLLDLRDLSYGLVRV